MEQLNKYCKSTKRLCKNQFISTKLRQSLPLQLYVGILSEGYLRACLHGGGGPQVCQGTRLSILSLIEFDRVYMTGG